MTPDDGVRRRGRLSGHTPLGEIPLANVPRTAFRAWQPYPPIDDVLVLFHEDEKRTVHLERFSLKGRLCDTVMPSVTSDLSSKVT